MTHELQSAAPVLSAPTRWALLVLAGVCLVLAVVGIVFPVMPTVPFLLVAAWAASRSSPRLHRWLLSHPRFGRQLRDWDEFGIVPRQAKWFATFMMALSGGAMAVVTPPPWLAAVGVVILAMLFVLVWLWRRPERRPVDRPGP
jgi:uncharacterized membrane protein YbaN (DUF454 family)